MKPIIHKSITRMCWLLGIVSDEVEVAIMPLEQWHRVHEEKKRLNKESEELRWRIKTLEAQLAAVEQGRTDAR